jgi:pimeloyl-ACP methyl ester carboxylesterase
MHGGGNDYDLIMSAPRYYARRLAHCGFAALVYDKRGTGQSGGVFSEATFDDFIDDAGNAAVFLSRDERIDPARIAIYGGSEGGQLAPVVSIRFSVIAAAISVSGPFASAVEQANHNMEYSLHSRGYTDSLVDLVMPLWRRHHAAWASRNPAEMRAVAAEIERLRKVIDTFALPSTEEEIINDTNLSFLKPGFNSMMKDYTAELSGLRVPFLAMYGELDPIVDVPKSIANVQEQMTIGGHRKYEIIVIDSVGHSLTHQRTGEQTPTVNIILNWLEEALRPQ